MSSADLAQDLAYRARALAQAHPMTAAARRYHAGVVEHEAAVQPMPEIGFWAGVALLNGYCVRQVEEADAGIEPTASTGTPGGLEAMVTRAATDLRAGDAGWFLLGAEDRTIGALERIVASEVERRLDHLRDEIDGETWSELSGYLAWWVVMGYALRVAETESSRSGAVS